MNPFLSRIPLRVIWLHLILPPSRIAQHNFRLGSDGADLWNLRALTTRFFPRSPPARFHGPGLPNATPMIGELGLNFSKKVTDYRQRRTKEDR
ncbi:hypothetical protein AFLA_009837 [Aspergillus flavus NRRL3357]|nr:hypothetical protein AFLA_009837 [Aspergillus flavus NRRL3357]